MHLHPEAPLPERACDALVGDVEPVSQDDAQHVVALPEAAQHVAAEVEDPVSAEVAVEGNGVLVEVAPPGIVGQIRDEAVVVDPRAVDVQFVIPQPAYHHASAGKSAPDLESLPHQRCAPAVIGCRDPAGSPLIVGQAHGPACRFAPG